MICDNRRKYEQAPKYDFADKSPTSALIAAIVSDVAAAPRAAIVLIIIVDADARPTPAIAALIAIIARACRRMVIMPTRTPHNSLPIKPRLRAIIPSPLCAPHAFALKSP